MSFQFVSGSYATSLVWSPFTRELCFRPKKPNDFVNWPFSNPVLFHNFADASHRRNFYLITLRQLRPHPHGLHKGYTQFKSFYGS